MASPNESRRLLMHVGPTNIDLDVLLAGVKINIGFTSKEFVTSISYSLKYLKKLVNADNNYQTFILPGSGTAAMESITSFLKRGDKVLIASNGVFGDRWEYLLRRYPVNVDVIRAEAGDYIRAELLEKIVSRNKYNVVTFTHVETSTGVKQPLEEVIKVVRGNVDLIVVDGVSSVGAEEIKTKDLGIDIIVTASQKAIGCPPGLGIVIASENALSRISEESVAGYYLNLKNWLNVMRNLEDGKPSYFSTLPVHLIFSLESALKKIEKEGIENRVFRHKILAGAIRAGIEAMGLEIVAKKPEAYSNTVTGVKVKKIDAGKILETSISEGVEFAPGVHPALHGKYFRIGHMGWVSYNDVISTIAAIERILYRLGEPIRVGEGIRATQQYLLERGTSLI